MAASHRFSVAFWALVLVVALLTLAPCKAQASERGPSSAPTELAFASAVQRIRLGTAEDASAAVVVALGGWRRVLPEPQRLALVEALRERLRRSVVVHGRPKVSGFVSRTRHLEVKLRAYLLDGLIQHDFGGDGEEVLALCRAQPGLFSVAALQYAMDAPDQRRDLLLENDGGWWALDVGLIAKFFGARKSIARRSRGLAAQHQGLDHYR